MKGFAVRPVANRSPRQLLVSASRSPPSRWRPADVPQMTADTLTPAVAGNGASRLGALIQAADDPAPVEEETAGATVDSSPTEAPAVTAPAGSDPARSNGLNDRVLRAQEKRRPAPSVVSRING